jgi:hypothetical protein
MICSLLPLGEGLGMRVLQGCTVNVGWADKPSKPSRAGLISLALQPSLQLIRSKQVKTLLT